ncbi:SAV_2336 N-terminal domain-related protein [Massilia sp. DJPM01]|uniref:SAV_2336 N-terminal domain-related protein n=1 Tax=Massilia sp. DJPM01 TaxID=3024404 RepID=UPI00259DFA8C|nr:SAV_2336 N-terminal domain-related protein [Massilia sp. DJPM01]MDM5177448.1 SAV_2336 N-terminal domain-related protein [Massilia sp. DJPM01]
MIGVLADSLRRAGLMFTVDELKDIVWLAGQLEGTGAPGGAAAPARAHAAAGVEHASEEPVRPTREQAAMHDQHGNAAADLPPVAASAGAAPDGIAAGVLRVPGVSGTGSPEHFRRGLQPFARRVPSRWNFRLDEVATAEHAADTGVWKPVQRAVRERNFDLVLVIEDCAVAQIRHQALAEMIHILRGYSGLRSVSSYLLEGGPNLHLRAQPSGVQYPVSHVQRSDSRQLVLFATDGTSPRWRDGSAQAFLYRLGALTSVSILHLLPQQAWRHTATGHPELMIHAQLPGARNTRLRATMPWWLQGKTGDAPMLVPVLGLDAATAGAWARTMSARGGAFVHGILLPSPGALSVRITALAKQARPAAVADPAALVAKYRGMVSKPAYDLAVFLSTIDPLTIAIMRLVQRAMLPKSTDEELSELVAGGLLAKVAPAESDAPAQERQYRFRPGVATELQKALRHSERREVDQQLLQVGRFLEQNRGDGEHFEALFPMPEGGARLSQWSMPFAEVSRGVLNGYAQRGRGQVSPVKTPAQGDGTCASAGGRTTLRILQLYDIHMGEAWETEFSRARPELGEAWRANMETLLAHGGVDVVCVSGDLTWRGAAKEFKEVGMFLDATLAMLKLGKDRLFVVPGNHDITRIGEKAAKGLIRTLPEGLGEEQLQFVKKSQENYRDWLASYLPAISAATPGPQADFRITLQGWRVPVHLIGLDSEWLADVPGDVPRVTHEQMEQALTGEDQRPLKGAVLALAHHTPDARLSQKTMRIEMAARGVTVLMHGHRSNADVAWSMRNRMFECWGRGMSLRSEEPMRMHAVELDIANLSVPAVRRYWSREWDALTGQWVTSQTDYWDGHGEIMHTRSLPPQAAEACPQFVGRERELEQLTRWFMGPASRPQLEGAQLGFIEGPAGIGKTALAEHFAAHVWARQRGGPWVTIPAGSRMEANAQLLKRLPTLGAPDAVMADAARFFAENGTLLILDGVDSGNPESYSVAKEVMKAMAGCPTLLIGRECPAELRGVPLLRLEPLESREVVGILQSLVKGASEVERRLSALADKWNGEADVLVSQAKELAKELAKETPLATAVSWLSRMIGRGASAPPSTTASVDADDSDEKSSFERAFAEWSTSDGHKHAWSTAMVALAHGPETFTVSLGAALTGMAPPSIGSDADMTAYFAFHTSAVQAGMLEGDRVQPHYRAHLRALWFEMEELVRKRWFRWVAARLSAADTQRDAAWDELDATYEGLGELMHSCSEEQARVLREACVPYARRRHATAPFIILCERMVAGQDAHHHPADPYWSWTLALLFHAAGNARQALEVIHAARLLFPSEAWTESNVADVVKLRMGLEGSHAEPGPASEDGSHAPAVPHRLYDNMLAHHRHIVRAALQATIWASSNRQQAGVVRQAAGTGLTTSLLAYLAQCHASSSLEPQPYIVVVDRLVCADVIMARLELGGAASIDCRYPASSHDLAALLKQGDPAIIVTTLQKLRQLQSVVCPHKCILVAYDIHQVANELDVGFPRATRIAFVSQSYSEVLADMFGDQIASYSLSDAIADGLLLPVKLRRVTLEHVLPPVGEEMGQNASDYDVLGRVADVVINGLQASGSPGKDLVIVENLQSALALRDHLAVRLAKHPQVVINIISGERTESTYSFDSEEGSDALLVIPVGRLAGIDLEKVRNCYVACTISPYVEQKIESLINRRNRSSDAGGIIDMAENSWASIHLETKQDTD